MTICGKTWKSDTSIDATGNISRGSGSFTTIVLLRTIDRVPAVKVSVKKCTTTRPQKMCTPKFGTLLVKADDLPEHEPVDEELEQRPDVGPQQAEERAR